MNRRGFVLGLGAISLAGCATLPSGGRRAVMPDPGLLEPVHAVSAGPEGVSVRMTSGGCTGRGDVAVYVDRTGRSPVLLVARRRLDTCRGFAAGQVDVLFTWAELGLAPGAAFTVLNPLKP